MMQHSPLDAAGPHAAAIARLMWFSFIVAALVFLATMSAAAWAVWRARRRAPGVDASEPRDAQRRMRSGVSAAVAATVAILLTFFGYDLVVGREIRTPDTPDHLLVKVTGNQWWWKVEYPDSIAEAWITDANEIHVPAGKPVLVELTSNDVIHSLWISSLAGKRDLIPRYKDTVWFQADEPGVYRAQCAEFCGHQHAKMALEVIAHDGGDFERWKQRARTPAPVPTDTLAMRGREVFLSGPCVLCHAIQGTPAGSRVGPDLTHVASRRMIAAGTLPNNVGNLAAWIVDPQRIKPGSTMPSNALSPADLEALLAYLQTLR